MKSATPAGRKREAPAAVFRSQIESALAEGLALDDLTLRLTLSDVSQLKRDRDLPLSAISYADGVMRFLGVRVEEGGVAVSELVRPPAD